MSKAINPVDSKKPDNIPLFEEYLTRPLTDWNQNFSAVVVAHMQDAYNQRSNRPIAKLADELTSLFSSVLGSASPEVWKVIRNDAEAKPDLIAAFMLGQLSLAHQFSADSALSRPDDEFYEAFERPVAKQLIVELNDKSGTLDELMEATELDEPTLKTELRDLTRVGIIDFKHRFIGKPPYYPEYALTPAAKGFLDTL